MLKKFFVLVIMDLLVMSSQIATAEDYDWNQAPRIAGKADLARYIESERRKGQTEIHFILTNFKLSTNGETVEEELDGLLDEYINTFAMAPGVRLSGIRGTGQLILKITKEYPGTRVANAYLSSNTSKLTAEEKQIYHLAVSIVDEANKFSSEVEKARYIHDEICRIVKEYKSHTNEDAIGAILFKVTNCQGYADAFYMIGRMSGLNVSRIGGSLRKGVGHVWNTITFSNGKTYCVDVTLDDKYNTHDYFLAPFEVMKRYHSCEWELLPNLQ